MFQLVPVAIPGCLEFLDQHIGLRNLTHLYVLTQNVYTQVLINMNMFHDWLVISNIKTQPFTNYIFLLSSVVSSIVNLQFLLNNLGRFGGDK